jgi:LemA protein
MMKSKGCRVIHLFFALVLLLVPASSQELLRDTPQPSSTQNSRSTNTQDEKAAEQGLWDLIKGGSDPQEYQAFLAKYPRGRFEGEARSRLSALLGEDFVTLFMKRIEVHRQWSNVEKQLGRRADIIPRLMTSSREAGVQERELFGQIAEARSRLLNATRATPQGEGDDKTPEQRRLVIDADNSFAKTLRRLGSLLENYPQLRSNERFLKALDELEGVGNRINVARADYNSAVQEYNNARSLPRMVGTAERHGFMEEPYFKSEQGYPAEPKINSVPPLLRRTPRASMDNAARNLESRA